MFVYVPQLLKAAVVINFRLLTEDPNMRLGARGASEVMFFSTTYFEIEPSYTCSFEILGVDCRMTMKLMQVKQHQFFRDINWDTLARQKV